MSGCDYLDNIKGIGLQRVLKTFQETNPKEALTDLLSKVLQPKDLAAYLNNIKQAKYSFKYQLVFNSAGKKDSDKLVHLNPLPKSMEANKTQFEPYIGSVFRFVESYSKGERRFQNENELRPVESSDFAKLCRFFAFIPRPVFGCLGNLTQRTIGFYNFHEFDDVLETNRDDSYIDRLRKSKQQIIDRNKELVEKRNKNRSVIETCDTLSTKTSVVKPRIIKKLGKKLIRTQRKRGVR